jgi:hypothetical protein
LNSRANKEAYLYELVDLHKGSILGKVLVKSNKGSVRPEGGVSDGEWVALTAAGNQILLFSLSSGLERAHFFGRAAAVAASAGFLAVEKDAKELDLYDLDSQQLRRRYVFSDPIALRRMSADGKRVLVLNASRTLYLFGYYCAKLTETGKSARQRQHLRSRRYLRGTLRPRATRKIVLFPRAWGEKKLTTSSS